MFPSYKQEGILADDGKKLPIFNCFISFIILGGQSLSCTVATDVKVFLYIALM